MSTATDFELEVLNPDTTDVSALMAALVDGYDEQGHNPDISYTKPVLTITLDWEEAVLASPPIIRGKSAPIYSGFESSSRWLRFWLWAERKWHRA